MIKYIGIFLISASISLFGILKSSEQNKAADISIEVLKLLRSLQNGITYGGYIKQDIYKKFSSKVLEECGFMDALINLNNVEDAVNTHLFILDKSEKDMLSGFFSEFGKSQSKQKEAEKCKAFIKDYEETVKIRCEQRKSKAMLYKKLSIICSIMTAVILI